MIEVPSKMFYSDPTFDRKGVIDMDRSEHPAFMMEHVELLAKLRNDGTAKGAFSNSDEVLRNAIPAVMENRKGLGLQGLVKGLQAIIINTEGQNFLPAVKDILDYTGMDLHSSFEGPEESTCVLKAQGSADILVRHRRSGENPFRPYNIAPKTEHLPNTRLETFVFETQDIDRYHAIQSGRGVEFLTDGPVRKENYSFIQTAPSPYTGNSVGLVQWSGQKGVYRSGSDDDLRTGLVKRDAPHLGNIRHLDHAATRLVSRSRDLAILEFMELTNYRFDFAIYVRTMNSITNVARLSDEAYAQVFTAGIAPFTSAESSGPTEKYVHNYGPRVHHLAFHTERIEDTYDALVQEGLGFLIELVGSPEEGLKQTFTKGMRSTFLVNEYIHRYGGFDGFFTKSNVTDLTRATDLQ